MSPKVIPLKFINCKLFSLDPQFSLFQSSLPVCRISRQTIYFSFFLGPFVYLSNWIFTNRGLTPKRQQQILVWPRVTENGKDRVRKLISQRMLHPDAGLILNTQSESCFRHLFFEAQIPTQQQLQQQGKKQKSTIRLKTASMQLLITLLLLQIKVLYILLLCLMEEQFFLLQIMMHNCQDFDFGQLRSDTGYIQHLLQSMVGLCLTISKAHDFFMMAIKIKGHHQIQGLNFLWPLKSSGHANWVIIRFVTQCICTAARNISLEKIKCRSRPYLVGEQN